MTLILRSLLLLAIILAAGHAASQPTTREAPGPSSTVGGPRDILRLFDVDESVWRFFRDGENLSVDELEPIYRLLYLLPRFDAAQRHQWRQVPDNWDAVAANPTDQRANLFLVTGHVESIDQHVLPAETAQRFGYAHFYELIIRSAVDQRLLSVCARQIPAGWSLETSGQPISCDALFVKTGEGAAPRESLVFVAERIAWHPHRADDTLSVGPGQALLGSHGMDVGRLPEVMQEQPLMAADREAFYQMLSAVRQMDPASVVAAARGKRLPVISLLQQPKQHVGDVFHLQGIARRVIRVLVDDPDIHQRFGIDHYYEVELFAPLDQPLHLSDARDGQTREYGQRFPVTVCVAELPPGMPQGDEIRESVEADGFFLKLWSYRSEFATGEGDTASPARRQISPLLIAPTVRLVSSAKPPNPWPGMIMAFLITSAVVTALAARGWYGRRDRLFQQWRRSRGRDVVIQAPPTSPPSADD